MYISTHTHNIHRILIIKKNEILPFAAKLMDLEGITLSEIIRRRIQKNTNTMIKLTCKN